MTIIVMEMIRITHVVRAAVTVVEGSAAVVDIVIVEGMATGTVLDHHTDLLQDWLVLLIPFGGHRGDGISKVPRP